MIGTGSLLGESLNNVDDDLSTKHELSQVLLNENFHQPF
jgi:hypothetical protein